MKIQTRAYRKRTFWEWLQRVRPPDTLPGSGGTFQFTPDTLPGGVFHFTGEMRPERAGLRFIYDEDGKEFQEVQ